MLCMRYESSDRNTFDESQCVVAPERIAATQPPSIENMLMSSFDLLLLSFRFISLVVVTHY